MSSHDIDYFLQRARDEREAAGHAPGTHIAEIHLEQESFSAFEIDGGNGDNPIAPLNCGRLEDLSIVDEDAKHNRTVVHEVENFIGETTGDFEPIPPRFDAPITQDHALFFVLDYGLRAQSITFVEELSADELAHHTFDVAIRKWRRRPRRPDGSAARCVRWHNLFGSGRQPQQRRPMRRRP